MEDTLTELHEWLDANWDPALTLGQWWSRLADAGWGFPAWPAQWFGRGLPGNVAKRSRAELGRRREIEDLLEFRHGMHLAAAL